jgi:hypothetical protein
MTHGLTKSSEPCLLAKCESSELERPILSSELKRHPTSSFLFYPVYWIAYNQMTGNLTSQAATMELNGVPNDIINNINPISLIVSLHLRVGLEYALTSRPSDLHSHLRSCSLPLLATQGNPILASQEDHCWFLLRYLGHDLVSPKATVRGIVLI